MKRVASRVVKIALALAVAWLVLSAIVVGVARELVGGINDFQPRLVEYFNENTDFQLQLESSKGSWKGLTAKIQLYNIQLRSPNEEGAGVRAQSLNLELLLLDSLLSFAPRFRLHIHGAQAQMRYLDGGFSIEGLRLPEMGEAKQSEDESEFDWLLAQRKLLITDSEVTATGLYDEPVHLKVRELQFEAGNRRRYILGHLLAEGPSTLSMHLRGKINGSFLTPGSAEGELYAQVENADWLPWIPQQKRGFSQADLTSLKGGAEFWVNLHEGRVDDLVSQFSIHDIAIESENDIQAPRVKQIAGQAYWTRPESHSWRLTLQNLDMETADFIWRPQLIQIDSSKISDQENQYLVYADNLKISPWINYFLAIQQKDTPLFKALHNTRPRGTVRDLFLDFTLKNEAIHDYRFALELSQVSNRTHRFIPGLHDVDVTVWGKKDLFIAQFDEDYVELTYPRIFRDQLTLNRLDGKLIFRVQPDQLSLQSNAMQLATNDVQAVTQLSLTFPRVEAEPPFMQLQATLRNADGRKTSTYLPSGVLHPKLVEWLDESIIDGQLLRGDILVHGPMKRHLPEPITVMLGFTAHNATLQFQPDWEEPIRNATADVIINRGEVIAHGVQGRYFDQQLQQGLVYSPKLTESIRPQLHVNVSTQGEAQQGIQVLKQTPLAKMIGGFVQDIDAKGELGVDLSLTVPLEKQAVTMLANADVALNKGWFRLNSQNLELNDLSGTVNFNLAEGLSSKAINGSAFGGAFTGAISTVKENQEQVIQITMNGKSELEQIKQWKPLSVLNVLEGDMKYEFALTVPLSKQETQKRQRIHLRSYMNGVTVNLPEPFAKAPQDFSQFDLDLTIDSKPTIMELRYGKLFHLITQSHEGKLQKGFAQLGFGDARLPKENQFIVQGKITEIDDSQWRPIINNVMGTAKENNEPVDETVPLLVDDSDLNIHQLTLGGVAYGPTDISVRRRQAGWMVAVNNAMVRGNAVVPQNMVLQKVPFREQKTPLIIDLEYLNLPKGEAANDEQDWQPMDLSPKTLPPLALSIGDFNYGDARFGLWRIKAKPSRQGMDIESLQATMKGVDLRGDGAWVETATGVRSSQLTAQVSAPNVADVMSLWGVEPLLSSKQARGRVDLNWPGTPTEFSLQRAAGNISAELKNGTFLNVNSNAAGRLWGALNFETFLRRLQLNFDDLRESDMVYDELEGQFGLQRGALNIRKLALNAPAIKLKANGDVDLQQQNLNVNLDVTVPIARNLVIPAAVIGGVPAAATVFVVEKVLGSQFDKLTTIKYVVTGEFENPKFEVQDSFSIIPKQVGEAVMSNGQDADGSKASKKRKQPSNKNQAQEDLP